MMPLKQFKEYLEEGIARKQTPDISRAKSLINESERSYNILRGIIEKIHQ